jgi:hypothetical protein
MIPDRNPFVPSRDPARALLLAPPEPADPSILMAGLDGLAHALRKEIAESAPAMPPTSDGVFVHLTDTFPKPSIGPAPELLLSPQLLPEPGGWVLRLLDLE